MNGVIDIGASKNYTLRHLICFFFRKDIIFDHIMKSGYTPKALAITKA